MDSSGLDMIEANDAWRQELRQHGIAFVQADDLAKQYRLQLKPVSQTIKETRENVISLLTSRGIPKCEIGELKASLKVVSRTTKKAPTQAMIKERCRAFFEETPLDHIDACGPDAMGEELYAYLSRKDEAEGVFLRRGTISENGGPPKRGAGQKKRMHQTLTNADILDDEGSNEDDDIDAVLSDM